MSDIEQGSREWLEEKSGAITGTRAHELMSSAITRRTLMASLVRELVTADRKQTFQTPAMKRGLDIEREAVSYYCIQNDVVVTDQLAYIESSMSPLFAASPDGLVGDFGGYEGKRLDEENHIKVLLGGLTAIPDGKKYTAQCNWNMFITGRQWWDLHFYCETLPDSMRSKVFRIERDPEYMDEMSLTARKLLIDLRLFLDEYGMGGLL